MTTTSEFLREAKKQDAAALRVRALGMSYLASQHERVARELRALAKKAAVQATGGTESS